MNKRLRLLLSGLLGMAWLGVALAVAAPEILAPVAAPVQAASQAVYTGIWRVTHSANNVSVDPEDEEVERNYTLWAGTAFVRTFSRYDLVSTGRITDCWEALIDLELPGYTAGNVTFGINMGSGTDPVAFVSQVWADDVLVSECSGGTVRDTSYAACPVGNLYAAVYSSAGQHTFLHRVSEFTPRITTSDRTWSGVSVGHSSSHPWTYGGAVSPVWTTQWRSCGSSIPPVNYCEDGIEALDAVGGPVTLAGGESEDFGMTFDTGLDAMQVRYVVEAESAWAGEGWINDAMRAFSHDVGGVHTMTVPALYGVVGPLANLLYENTGASTVDLLSACIITGTLADYCATGVELVTETLTLDAGASWTGEADTAWDMLYTQYTFLYEDPDDWLAMYGADLSVNDTDVERVWGRYSVGDEEINGQWVHQITVPNRDDSTLGDYLDPAYEEGPDVAVEVTARASSDPLQLASVCVLEVQDIDWCTDGVELLEAPVALGDVSLNNALQVSGTMTGTDIMARIVVEDPLYPTQSNLAAEVRFISGVGGSYYQSHYIDFTSDLWQPSRYITATLPNTGTIPLLSSGLTVRYRNQRDPVIVHSICIVDGEDANPITEERCNLYNPDFTVAPGGANNWTDAGTVDWSIGLQGTGEVELTGGGQVSQTALIPSGDVYEMEIMVRSDGGGQALTYGSPSTSFLGGGPQLYSVTVEPLYSWWVLQRDIYLAGPGSGNPSAVLAAGDGVTVDYICLNDDAGLYDDIECTLPIWDPPANEGILSGQFWNYVWEHTRAVLLYVLCMILKALARIQTVIRDVLMVVPALPEPGSGLISWLEWIGLLVGRFGDYAGRNMRNVALWFPRAGDTAGRWLLRVLNEVFEWFIGLFGLDATWLAEMRDVIYTDGRVFVDAVMEEVRLEFGALTRLVEDTAGIFLILINGFAGGASGAEVAPVGRDIQGVGRFIWTGFDFFNEAISNTPLIALNILGLGMLALGLGQWTLQKLLSMLESVSL